MIIALFLLVLVALFTISVLSLKMAIGLFTTYEILGGIFFTLLALLLIICGLIGLKKIYKVFLRP